MIVKKLKSCKRKIIRTGETTNGPETWDSLFVNKQKKKKKENRM